MEEGAAQSVLARYIMTTSATSQFITGMGAGLMAAMVSSGLFPAEVPGNTNPQFNLQKFLRSLSDVAINPTAVTSRNKGHTAIVLPDHGYRTAQSP